jgi:hypothetical protein
MKKFALVIILALLAAPAMFAQNHGEVGVYADYYRPEGTNGLNLFGVGGRLGFNVHPNVAIEAEGSYDFKKSFTPNVSDIFTTGTTRSDLKVTHFLFGPKFQAGGDHAVRAFIVLKGGAARFGVTPGPVTFGTFPTRTENTDTKGVFYPGGGIEFFAGPFGIRAEIGDEIFFDNGAHNGLKIMAGPTIRF